LELALPNGGQVPLPQLPYNFQGAKYLGQILNLIPLNNPVAPGGPAVNLLQSILLSNPTPATSAYFDMRMSLFFRPKSFISKNCFDVHYDVTERTLNARLAKEFQFFSFRKGVSCSFGLKNGKRSAGGRLF
jgi:hypothetical protein